MSERFVLLEEAVNLHQILLRRRLRHRAGLVQNGLVLRDKGRLGLFSAARLLLKVDVDFINANLLNEIVYDLVELLVVPFGRALLLEPARGRDLCGIETELSAYHHSEGSTSLVM